MALYPLDKKYSVDFSNPRKKPISNFEIDFDNSISKGLDGYFNQSIAVNMRNLSGNSGTPTITGSPVNEKSIDGSSVKYGSGAAIENNIKITDATEKTFMFYGSDELNTTDRGMLTLSDGTTSNRYVIYITASEDYAFFTSNAATNVISFAKASSPAPTSTKKHRHIITCTSGDTRWYIDGELITSSALAFAPETGVDTLGVSCFEDTATANGAVQNVSEVAVWSRILTSNEIRDLSTNPYQLLKPKTPPVYFTPSISGGTNWNAIIKDALDNNNVVLSDGDTVATITLPAFASYDTDVTETITWTIPAASLTTSATPIVATPTHTITSSAANTLTADSGSYSYTGTNAELIRAKILIAASGSYTYTGTSVNLLKGHLLAADSGSYVYTGTDATLIFTPAGSFVLTADTGTYSYTGQDINFNRNRVIIASSGNYTYNGTDIQIILPGQIWTDKPSVSTNWTNQTKVTTIWTDK